MDPTRPFRDWMSAPPRPTTPPQQSQQTPPLFPTPPPRQTYVDPPTVRVSRLDTPGGEFPLEVWRYAKPLQNT